MAEKKKFTLNELALFRKLERVLIAQGLDVDSAEITTNRFFSGAFDCTQTLTKGLAQLSWTLQINTRRGMLSFRVDVAFFKSNAALKRAPDDPFRICTVSWHPEAEWEVDVLSKDRHGRIYSEMKSLLASSEVFQSVAQSSEADAQEVTAIQANKMITAMARWFACRRYP